MKAWKILGVVLVSVVLLATLFGCGKKSSSAATTQEYTVKKGDVSLTITAAGNLALSQTQDLALDLFYPSGTKATIASVLVEVGDSVKKDQVLVTIDKDEWNDQLNNVQSTYNTAQRNASTKSFALTDAQRSLASLQRAVTTAQNNVTKAQRTVVAKQLAVTQAQLNVVSANNTLNDITDVKNLQDDIDNARFALQFATNMLGGQFGGGAQLTDYAYWTNLKSNAQTELTQLQAEMRDLLGGTSTTTSADVALMVAQKVYALNQANLAMGDAQIAVDDAMTAVTAAQQAVDDASYAVTKQQQAADNAKLDLADTQKALQDASKKLADAQGKSPEIKAPFDGFVTDINVSGGDQVPNGTVAVTVADPNKFEADIMVSEMDIMKVSLGEGATVSLNAITGLQLPAKVTRIAPTASIASGVVNYVVKVELDEQAVSRIQAAGASANTTAGATANATGPGGAALQRAIDSGRIPQAQAEAAQQALQSGNFPSGGFPGGRASSQLPSSGTTQNFQLKQGLTGTVDLIVAQKSNVLLVPSSAISKSGNQSTVQVMTSNNTIEKRTIQTGLADWQNTEVTGGLNEGDKIVITKATSTATSTSSSQQGPPQGPPGGIFIGR